MKFLYALILLPFVAVAHGTHPAPQPPAQPKAQAAKSKAVAKAEAKSESKSESNAVAETGPVSQSVAIDTPRQAPSTAQGAIFIPECGVGGNAGGSNTGGSAFLGIAYVPAWCQDFKYAAFLMAAGDYVAACQVMAESKPGKRAAKRGIKVPQCSAPAVPQPAVEPPPTVVVLQGESCASKERDHRILEKCLAK